MDLAFETNSPEGCSAVGLDCDTCIADSALQIAACCRTLKGSGLTQIFSSLYPAKACSPMSEVFRDAYLSAVRPKAAAAAA